MQPYLNYRCRALVWVYLCKETTLRRKQGCSQEELLGWGQSCYFKSLDPPFNSWTLPWGDSVPLSLWCLSIAAVCGSCWFRGTWDFFRTTLIKGVQERTLASWVMCVSRYQPPWQGKRGAFIGKIWVMCLLLWPGSSVSFDWDPSMHQSPHKGQERKRIWTGENSWLSNPQKETKLKLYIFHN